MDAETKRVLTLVRDLLIEVRDSDCTVYADDVADEVDSILDGEVEGQEPRP